MGIKVVGVGVVGFWNDGVSVEIDFVKPFQVEGTEYIFVFGEIFLDIFGVVVFIVFVDIRVVVFCF